MKFYWIKLKDDFFNTKEIKKLRRIAGGDTYTIIYLKLQLLSLKRDGKLIYEGIEDNLVEELASEISEEIENVQVTINFLKNHGMIEEIEDNEFFLPKAIENMGKEGDSAERVRRFRDKQKALQCNNLVTENNIDIREEKREKRKEKREKTTNKDIEDIINYLNLMTNSRYMLNNTKTINLIQNKLDNHYSIEDLRIVIDKKSKEWLNTDYEKYLRPETLFGNKFESYLNQKEYRKSNTITTLQDLYNKYSEVTNE